MNYDIEVKNKRATLVGAQDPDLEPLVCGNDDYTVTFTFDEEWAGYTTKTARFSYRKKGNPAHQDIVFTGNTAKVPVMSSVREVRVGVFAGDLRTTTSARIPCLPSCRCNGGAPEEPAPDVYDQLMELYNQGLVGPPGPQGETGPRGEPGVAGPQGIQGERGEAFSIAKVYTSTEEMHADFDTEDVKEGQFVLVNTGNVEDEDNATLYLKGKDGYSFITDLSGATGMQGPPGVQGIQGVPGETPVLKVGKIAGRAFFRTTNGDTTETVYFLIPYVKLTDTTEGVKIEVTDEKGTATTTIKHGQNYVLTDDDKAEISKLVLDLIPTYAGEVEEV